MATPKITVLFYSTYGTNHAVAQVAAAAIEATGAQVRLRRVRETAPEDVVSAQDAWKAQLERMSDIPEAALDDMDWADGYFFAAPTRFGVVASQFRAFIDTLGPLWQDGKLAGKTITATTSSQSTHGGRETTFLSMYLTAMHWGAVIVPPGYADPVKFEDGGNPYGFSTGPGALDETARRSIRFQAERLASITSKLIA